MANMSAKPLPSPDVTRGAFVGLTRQTGRPVYYDSFTGTYMIDGVIVEVGASANRKYIGHASGQLIQIEPFPEKTISADMASELSDAMLDAAMPRWDCRNPICGGTGMLHRAQFCSRCGHLRHSFDGGSSAYHAILNGQVAKPKRRRVTWRMVFAVLFVLWLLGHFVR